MVLGSGGSGRQGLPRFYGWPGEGWQRRDSRHRNGQHRRGPPWWREPIAKLAGPPCGWRRPAGGTQLRRAGLPGASDMAAEMANDKSAMAAGGGDDGERGAYGNRRSPDVQLPPEVRVFAGQPPSADRPISARRLCPLVLPPIHLPADARSVQNLSLLWACSLLLPILSQPLQD